MNRMRGEFDAVIVGAGPAGVPQRFISFAPAAASS